MRRPSAEEVSQLSDLVGKFGFTCIVSELVKVADDINSDVALVMHVID
jgi:hypothetical protein